MTPSRPPRPPRYRGKNPRRFEEKYKERDPQRYGEMIAKVLASGKTPAGTHRPVMVQEILEVLAPEPGSKLAPLDRRFGPRRFLDAGESN
jgi:16S rRNA (cytosine1402-N4)-methyltransferase